MRAYTGYRRADIHRAKYRMSVEAEARRQLAPKKSGGMSDGAKALIFYAVFGLVGLEVGGQANHDSGGAALIGLVIGLVVATVVAAALVKNTPTTPPEPPPTKTPSGPDRPGHGWGG